MHLFEAAPSVLLGSLRKPWISGYLSGVWVNSDSAMASVLSEVGGVGFA